MAKTTRACPYCGEEIKLTAVKCRFCGELLEEDEDEDDEEEDEEEDDDDDEDEGGGLKWVAPVGRNGFAIAAGYLGILALVPLFLIFYGFFGNENRVQETENILQVADYISIAVGATAFIVGALAIVMVVYSGKGGMGRAIFAMVAGLWGALGYYYLDNYKFIPTVVNINKAEAKHHTRGQTGANTVTIPTPTKP